MSREFKSFYKTVGGGEGQKCHYPTRLDTYGCGCQHDCSYCYAKSLLYFRKQWHAKDPAVANIKDIEKVIAQIPAGTILRLGGMTDCFQPLEKEVRNTYKTIQLLNKRKIGYLIVTKSAWVFHDPKYQELFKGADNWNVKFSIITLDPEDARRIEVGVASPEERLEAMRIYNTLSKGGTTLRLRPFICGVSDKTYLDLIRKAKEAGATAVTTEFFCLEMRSMNQAKEHYEVISKCAGFDIVEFYRKYSNGSGYLRLNRKIKEPFIQKMQDLCHELGMRFYVSDAHFKECCDNCSCCALPPNWDYSRGNFSAALQIAKKTGQVKWSDIEKDMYFLEFPITKAQGFNLNSTENRARLSGMTMKDYLHYLWNAPRRGQSPYKLFEKVLIPDGYDENGDIIYKYNTEVTFEPQGNEDSVNNLRV